MSVLQPVAVPPIECRFCGKILPSPSPMKCPGCEAFQSACSTCGHPIPAGAKRCNQCKAFQTGRPCRSCGALVPRGARCGVCNAAQDIRRLFPDTQLAIALVMALISLLAAVVPQAVRAWNYGSDSHVRFDGLVEEKLEENGIPAPTSAICIAVANRGTGYAAVVKSASITFDAELGLAPADLYVLNPKDTLVAPQQTTVVRLALSDELRRAATTKTKEEILRLARGANVTVVLKVEEKRPFRKSTIEERTETIPGVQIHAFFEEHVL